MIDLLGSGQQEVETGQESPGLLCVILKASDTRKINVSVDENTK